MQSPSDIRDGTKSPTSQICVEYTERNVRIFIQRDTKVSLFKTLNTVSRWNGVRGQENDERLHTTPRNWKYKSIKWMCGEKDYFKIKILLFDLHRVVKSVQRSLNSMILRTWATTTDFMIRKGS